MTVMEPGGESGPIRFAHRGARAHAPENTLQAFVHGLRMGATALESDAWMTRDGAVVLLHDGVVPGTRRPLHTADRADLPPWVPTLAELYAACGTEVELSLDVKDPRAFRAVRAVAIAADALPRLWVCDTDLARVCRWAGEAPDARLVASLRIDRVRRDVDGTLESLQRAGVAALNLRGPNWTPQLVRRCHAAGLAAFAWDLQSLSALRRCARWGIDAVYSDHSDLLRVLGSETTEA